MTPSLLVLLVANALPIVGVLVLGWTVFPLVLLYWLENVIVGGFNGAKLLLAQPREPANWAGKLFGGWIIIATGAPVLALVLLALISTAADARAHKAERSRFAALPAA